MLVQRDESRRLGMSVQLAIGLGIALVALALFIVIMRNVLDQALLTRLDTQFLGTVRARSTSSGDRLFVAVSLVGSPVAMSVLGLGGAVLLYLRRHWVMLSGWLVAFIGCSLLVVALKRTIQRARPGGASAFLHGESFSFPSGHSLGAFVGFGMLAYVLTVYWTKRRVSRAMVCVAGALCVLAIGFSRLYLGVHYFTDVVGGFAAGALWLSLCITGTQYARHRTHRDD